MARLKSSARAFQRAWGRPRPVERRENLRILEAFATLGFCAAVVWIGAIYDATATRWAAQQPPELIEFFAQITHLGASGYVFATTALIAIGALLARGRGLGRGRDAALAALSGRAFYLFTVAAVSGIAAQALKHMFGRARPKFIDIVGPLHFDAFSFDASFASFPSGHAVTAFAMAVGLGALAPKLRWPLLALAALVAASRVMIGAHYLSDVLAGAGLGFAAAVLVRRAFAARGIVFRRHDGGLRIRGAGLVRGLFSGAGGRQG